MTAPGLLGERLKAWEERARMARARNEAELSRGCPEVSETARFLRARCPLLTSGAPDEDLPTHGQLLVSLSDLDEAETSLGAWDCSQCSARTTFRTGHSSFPETGACRHPSLSAGMLVHGPCGPMKAQIAEALRSDRLRSARLGARFHSRTFETYRPTNSSQRAAMERCIAWVEATAAGKGEGRGLWLTGRFGTGKTHLAAGCVHGFIARGREVLYQVWPEFLASMKGEMDRPKGSPQDLLDELRSARILILDDVGAERNSEWAIEALWLVVNHRYEHLLPMLLTSNCATDALAERVGERIVSRLIEMTVGVAIDGPDYRQRAVRVGDRRGDGADDRPA